jgi:hypothetical protein
MNPAVKTTPEGRAFSAKMSFVSRLGSKVGRMVKEARKQYSEQEKRALQDENLDGAASNKHKLRLEGAGYDDEGQMGADIWML